MVYPVCQTVAKVGAVFGIGASLLGVGYHSKCYRLVPPPTGIGYYVAGFWVVGYSIIICVHLCYSWLHNHFCDGLPKTVGNQRIISLVESVVQTACLKRNAQYPKTKDQHPQLLHYFLKKFLESLLSNLIYL